MKQSHFIIGIIILLLLTVGFFYFTKKNEQRNLEQQKIQSALFGEEHVSSSGNWSVYKNVLFRFSFDVPPNMVTQHTVENWRKKEKVYADYGIWFSDINNVYSIFSISIKETLLTSIEEYIAQNGGYAGFIFEEKVISGIRVLSAISAQDPIHPQPEESRERHLLFIRDGFFFDIVVRNMPTQDVERVFKSLRFLAN